MDYTSERIIHHVKRLREMRFVCIFHSHTHTHTPFHAYFPYEPRLATCFICSSPLTKITSPYQREGRGGEHFQCFLVLLLHNWSVSNLKYIYRILSVSQSTSHFLFMC